MLRRGGAGLVRPLPLRYTHPVLPEVVLLDLDDTLLRFSSGQPDYWRAAAEALLPPGEIEPVLARIVAIGSRSWGDPEWAFWGRQNMWEARRRIARRALTDADAPHELADRLGDCMTRGKEDGVRPFEGALDALGRLTASGRRLGLLTNGSGEFQRRKLERFDLTRWFELILIEGELGFGKPDPRVFERALRHFGRDASDACMVGDNLAADVRGAQALGISGIWHDCDRLGRVPPGVDVVPDRIISRVSELA